MVKKGGKEKMVKVTCHKSDCGYSWDSDSQMKFVTCPSCGRKTLRIKEEKIPMIANV